MLDDPLETPLNEGEISPFETPYLFQPQRYHHEPRLPHEVHREQVRSSSLNKRLAVLLTKGMGSMWAAYLFTLLAGVGLLGLLGLLNPFTFLVATWFSQQFLQLVALPVISVGQRVLEEKQVVQDREQFETTRKTYHDLEQVMQHLLAQDAELLKQTRKIETMQQSILKLSGMVLYEPGEPVPPEQACPAIPRGIWVRGHYRKPTRGRGGEEVPQNMNEEGERLV